MTLTHKRPSHCRQPTTAALSTHTHSPTQPCIPSGPTASSSRTIYTRSPTQPCIPSGPAANSSGTIYTHTAQLSRASPVGRQPAAAALSTHTQPNSALHPSAICTHLANCASLQAGSRCHQLMNRHIGACSMTTLFRIFLTFCVEIMC